jgi:hypothetical protein
MVDRTIEFQQLCKNYSHRQVEAREQPRVSTIKKKFYFFRKIDCYQKKSRNLVQENVQFSGAAADISREVFQASKRLQQLTQCMFVLNVCLLF